ncbi:hypothetical protein Glove_199g193 [Diversispora epigaea]|uniref:Uncharacterized protein n=1 Tax=Diversispora epigaea TaxID=1348612 RepID=A0A397IJY5_9GLOM|nr:hypothetical protein Glove_199g193 [Diversispora epigaea]
MLGDKYGFRILLSAMSARKIHEFFNRDPENWDILSFLEECNLPVFKQMTESYTTSLEVISNTQKGPRSERADKLLHQYREGPDYALARSWKKEKKDIKSTSGQSVHFHQVMDNSVIGISNGSFSVNSKSKRNKDDKKSDDEFQPLITRSIKRKKQSSLPKNNEVPAESTSLKRGNDDDSSLSTESPNSENDELVVDYTDYTQDIEATIIDKTFETLVKESLARNGDWFIGFGSVNVRESLKKWKCEKDRPLNDLGYYDIIDLTPGTNSDFINSLSKSEYEEMKCFNPPKIPNTSDFRKEVNENFLSTRNDESKEFAWDFAYHLANSFDHGNDLLHLNMSERMYREIFLTPVIRSLFRKKSTDLDLFFGEVCLYASAEDQDLKKNDAEERSSGRKIDVVWATKPPKVEFAICEVSGPPNQRQHSHFFTDKIKIGKMLKIMLNRIVRVYGGNSSIFSLLKLYGLQIYDHNIIVYEMTVPFRELYVFREVIRSQLPTSQVNIAQMRQCIPIFLLFKEMLLKSLNDLHEYIMEAGLCTPPDNIKASLFVTEMMYTFPSKEIEEKKSN